MNAPARNPAMPEERDGPPLFVGIQLEVDEIVIAHNGLKAKCVDLRAAMTARHEAGVKQAAEDIAYIARQMQSLSAHLSSVIARHQTRNPKFPK